MSVTVTGTIIIVLLANSCRYWALRTFSTNSCYT